MLFQLILMTRYRWSSTTLYISLLFNWAFTWRRFLLWNKSPREKTNCSIAHLWRSTFLEGHNFTTLKQIHHHLSGGFNYIIWKLWVKLDQNSMISKYWWKSNMIWNHHQKDFSSIQTVCYENPIFRFLDKNHQLPARPDWTSLSLGFVWVNLLAQLLTCYFL